MGSFFKGKTVTTKNPYEQNPWEPQQDYLLKGFEGAAGALDGALGSDAVANMTPEQLAAIGGITDTGMNTAQQIGQQAMSVGMDAMGNVGQQAANAQDIYGQAQTDRTGQVIDNGALYANNPYLQGQIDSVMKDLNTGFQRQVGDINGAATGSGNINSTRAGVLEAIAQKDAMDRGATISANMRSGAWENGVDRSMQMDQARMQQMLAANAQLGQSGALGLDFANSGLQTSLGGYGSALDANSMIQQQNQNELTGQRTGDMDLLQQYMQLVGGNYGSEGFQTTTTQKPSLFQTLVGGAASLGGAGFKLPGMG